MIRKRGDSFRVIFSLIAVLVYLSGVTIFSWLTTKPFTFLTNSEAGTGRDKIYQLDIDNLNKEINKLKDIISDKDTKIKQLELEIQRGNTNELPVPRSTGQLPVPPPPVKDGNLLAELRENQSGWVINGSNYSLVNSKLMAKGLFNSFVKDSRWDNYAVEFDVKQLVHSGYHLSVLMRRQGDTDYIGLQLRSWHNCGSRWVISRERTETVLVNSEMSHTCDGHYRIEVEGNRYTLLKDGNQIFVLNNNAFASGGIGLKAVDGGYGGIVTFTIDNFKVVSLRQ